MFANLGEGGTDRQKIKLTLPGINEERGMIQWIVKFIEGGCHLWNIFDTHLFCLPLYRL